VGDTQPRAVDLRVVADSHRALPELVDNGRFRADLYARLAGFTLTLPPLRERRDDLGVLTALLLARARARSPRLTPEAAAAILTHDGPHNIRELEQRLTTALALAGDQAIDSTHLGPLATAPAASDSDGEEEGEEEDPRARLIALLTLHRGNVTEVARAMGRSRLQVYRWLRRFQIDPRAYR